MFWSEYVHMYFAAYIVCGFLLAGGLRVGVPARAARPVRADRARHHAVRRLGRRAAAGDRRGLGGAGRGHLPAGQARRDGRARHDDARRGRAPARLVQRARRGLGRRDPPPAVAARVPQPERRGQGPGHRAAGRPAAGQRRAVLLPDHGRHRDAARAARAGVPVPAVPAPRPAAASCCGPWWPRGRCPWSR